MSAIRVPKVSAENTYRLLGTLGVVIGAVSSAIPAVLLSVLAWSDSSFQQAASFFLLGPLVFLLSYFLPLLAVFLGLPFGFSSALVVHESVFKLPFWGMAVGGALVGIAYAGKRTSPVIVRSLVLMVAAGAFAWGLFGFRAVDNPYQGVVTFHRTLHRILKITIDKTHDGLWDQAIVFNWSSPYPGALNVECGVSYERAFVDRNSDGAWDLWYQPGGASGHDTCRADVTIDLNFDGSADVERTLSLQQLGELLLHVDDEDYIRGQQGS